MNTKRGVKASELCRSLDIQPYVLRYWETEFKALAAPAGTTGQRSYGEEEVALVRRIKQLLYDEGYTIAGAKKKIETEPIEAPPVAPLFETDETTESAETGGEELADAGEPAEDVVEAAPSERPRKRASRTKNSRAAEAEAPATADTAAMAAMAATERVTALETGVADALREARALLELLERKSR